MDMDYYTYLHNQYAGDRFCDHMHNGMGFLPQHLALTLAYEQGMQAVDPLLTVPYWDFTKEAHDIFIQHDGDFDALWDMEIFTSDWYGDARNEYHTVVMGRWAWTKTLDSCWTCVHNHFGYLRAPWNINNSPFIQRWRTLGGLSSFNVHLGWPICEYHHFALTAYDTWAAFSLKIASEPHGAIHGIIGGTFHSDWAYDELEEIMSYEDTIVLRSHSYNTPKNMWRTGVLDCPDFCAPTELMEDCQCNCGNAEKLEKLLDDPDVLEWYYDMATAGGKLETPFTDDERKDIVKIMCNAGTAIGDQLESASPSDIIFWPIHPTIERIFFWLMLKKGLADKTWPQEKSYRGTFYRNLDDNCYGHGPHDVMPFFIYVDDGTEWQSFYTTTQFVQGGNAGELTWALPFVYDNYVWLHCLEEGYDFDNV